MDVTQIGRAVLVAVSLLLMAIPLISVSFPKYIDTVDSETLHFWTRNSSYRELMYSPKSAKLLKQLDKPDAWLSKEVTTQYLAAMSMAVVVLLIAIVGLHVNVLICLLLLLVFAFGVAPFIAVKFTAASIRGQFRKQQRVYADVVTNAMILVASQVKGSTSTDVVIDNLGKLLPSSYVERFSRDIKSYRTDGDRERSIGEAFQEFGEAWEMPSLVLIGNTFDLRIPQGDVADQILSQVTNLYINKLNDDQKTYSKKARSLTLLSVFSVSIVVIISVAVILVNSLHAV